MPTDLLNTETRASLEEMIIDVSKIAEDVGLPIWLDMGTLLGYVRENGITEWDNDVDLATHADMLKVNFKRFKYNLEKSGFVVKNKGSYLQLTQIANGGENLSVSIHIWWRSYNKDLVYISSHKDYIKNQKLFFKFKKYLSFKINPQKKIGITKRILLFFISDFILISISRHLFASHYVVKNSTISDLKKKPFLDGQVLIPKNYKKYLESFYGPGWKTPDKNWHHGKYYNLVQPYFFRKIK